MSTTRRGLTTTSYAILGLINLRAWTGYELARQMNRSLEYIWPRATSAIYEEPRNLVAHGFARATEEKTGRRPRTVYAITDAGRAALGAWLAGESAPPQFESEVLVRISFPEAASKSVLLNNIESLRAQAEAVRDKVLEQASGYLSPEHGPFPGRLHVIALDARFVFDYADFLARWGTWAKTQVAAWPSGRPPAARDSLKVLRSLAEPQASPVSVRQMRPDEAPLVAGLTLHAYAEFSQRLSERAWAQYQADLLNVASRARRGTVLVADVGGSVAGAVCYLPSAHVDALPHGYAFIRALAVAPPLRGRGVARALTEACIELAGRDGRPGIGLHTTDLMVAALALYKKLGFREISAERHPIGVPLRLLVRELE